MTSARCSRIPKDQQKLLDHEDAWTCRASIPQQLLETLVKAHAAKVVAPLPTQSIRPMDASSKISSAGISNVGEAQAVTSQCEATPSEQECSSWSPSPEHHLHPPRRKELANELNTQASPKFELGVSAKQKAPKRAPSPVPTECSEASDLEHVIPKDVTDNLDAEGDTNVAGKAHDPGAAATVATLTVRPEPTPPSAQIIHSSTFTDNMSPEKHPSVNLPRLVQDARNDFEENLRLTAPSSSTISVEPAPNWSPRRMLLQKPGISGGTANTSLISSVPTGEAVPSTSGLVAASAVQGMTQQLTSSAEWFSPNGPLSQNPYLGFMCAYPDFEGERREFVSALLYVQRLRSLQRIPDFLCDDYIRFFCHEFTGYVTGEAGRDGELLTCFHLYNKNVAAPRYDKGLISSSNIDDILNKFPALVRKIAGDVNSRREDRSESRKKTQQDVETTGSLTTKAESMMQAKKRASSSVDVAQNIHRIYSTAPYLSRPPEGFVAPSPEQPNSPPRRTSNSTINLTNPNTKNRNLRMSSEQQSPRRRNGSSPIFWPNGQPTPSSRPRYPDIALSSLHGLSESKTAMTQRATHGTPLDPRAESPLTSRASKVPRDASASTNIEATEERKLGVKNASSNLDPSSLWAQSGSRTSGSNTSSTRGKISRPEKPKTLQLPWKIPRENTCSDPGLSRRPRQAPHSVPEDGPHQSSPHHNPTVAARHPEARQALKRSRESTLSSVSQVESSSPYPEPRKRQKLPSGARPTGRSGALKSKNAVEDIEDRIPETVARDKPPPAIQVWASHSPLLQRTKPGRRTASVNGNEFRAFLQNRLSLS